MKEEIVKLAREAGFCVNEDGSVISTNNSYGIVEGELERLVDIVRAEERKQRDLQPFGWVTVRWLSKKYKDRVDQYQFYPRGQSPYLDNVDQCYTVYLNPTTKDSSGVGTPNVKDLLRRSRNLLSHPPSWWEDNELSRIDLIGELDQLLRGKT